ncbi:MAG: hypothetical protein QM706_09390 [Nitrospira sp.]
MEKRHACKRDFTSIVLAGMVLAVVISTSGCSFFHHGRSVYDRDGIRIGVEADPSIRRSSPPVLNNHPKDLTPREIESLLQSLQVSGYSGTLVGLVTRPQPVALFTPKELSTISGPLASAFRELTRDERVSFSLPKPDVVYSEDRTAGFLFFRGPYLHVIVTDHASIIRTDTGGGEARDIRDTKGMTLSVTTPTRTAIVPDSEQPQWMPFERIHLSLNANEVLAQKERVPGLRMNQEGAASPSPVPAATAIEGRQGTTSLEDLQHHVQELSSTNQELRGRLDEQNKQMQALQDQVERLRRELLQPAPKRKPYKTAPPQ